MQIHLDRRAEIALSSLNPRDLMDVEAKILMLSELDESNWYDVIGAKILKNNGGEAIYSIRAGNNLRILSRLLAGGLIIQDIFPAERLEDILGARPSQ